MHRTLTSIGTAALCCFAVSAHAETLHITPELVDSSDTVQQALDENDGHASTTLVGEGKALALEYSANETITVFLVPLKEDGTYVPTDFLRFFLPAAENGDVLVDLTVSPGWSSGERKYLVNMLSKSSDANASFLRLDFIPTTVFTGMSAGMNHFFTTESYLPSSYHALHGYRIFGHHVSLWFGLLCIFIAIAAVIICPRGKKVSALLIVLIGGSFLYSLRFALDELRFAFNHVTEYQNGTYDEAGSIHLVAEVLRSSADKPEDNVYVCRDGTNFKEKLLRYFVYPIKVSAEPLDASGATFALVMDKRDWNIETVIDTKGSRQTLRCGSVHREAQMLTKFEDGSVLFSINPIP